VTRDGLGDGDGDSRVAELIGQSYLLAYYLTFE
jgi:hypothetical protein